MMRNILRNYWIVVCLGVAAVLLAACDLPWPPPTSPAASPIAEAGTPAEPSPTQTQSVATPSSTPTQAPPSPSLPPPTAERVQVTSVTPAPTQSPSSTPPPTSSPGMILPTPGGPPLALIEHGLRLQTEGDYAAAAELFRQALAEAATDEHRRQAAYHLAECYIQLGDYANAALAWEAFLTQYPTDPRRPVGAFLLAESLAQINDCPGAVEAYSAYLAQETILADLAYEGIGGCMATSQQIPAALEAYESALTYAPDASAEIGLRENIARLHLAQDQFALAQAQYDAILEIARIPGQRARILYLSGQAHLSAGDQAAAYGRFREAMDNYPEEEFGYLSLTQLVDGGQPVDDLHRGKVDYYAGKLYPEAYAAALSAFERVLQEPPSERAEEARYHIALTYGAQGQWEQAARAWETFLARHPTSSRAPGAYLELARADERLERSDRARRTLTTLVGLFPEHDLALEALWRIATSLEQSGDLEAAAATYRDIQRRFPGSDRAAQALFRAGLADYRRGDLAQAQQTWNNLLDGYPQAGLQPQTLFWLSRVAQAQGEDTAADEFASRLLAGWPSHFYALHMAELQAGDSISLTRISTAPVLVEVGTADWEAIATWLGGWTELPSETRLDELSEPLRSDPNLQRASRFLSVHRPLEARRWSAQVRSTWTDDPLALAQLVAYFQQTGLQAEAARAAYRLWRLSPTVALADLPLSLQQIIYPLAFLDSLNEAAAANNLDPLLLAALVRQESYFDPVATSSAGARGLAQVMPATGEGIARSLQWPDFSLDDLYRPFVSLRFGAWYLRVQLNRFDDDPWKALAAYNGGPGNALRWQERSGGDRELFVEMISLTESRTYVQRVYEQWVTYNRLYRNQGP